MSQLSIKDFTMNRPGIDTSYSEQACHSSAISDDLRTHKDTELIRELDFPI